MGLFAYLRYRLGKRTEFRQREVLCAHPGGLHRLAYTEWGDPHNPRVLLCVHGLLRTGRDFDRLAAALDDDYRVICPDVAGRGKSDWLPEAPLYALPQYANDLVTLIARLDVPQVDWLGTSMGGLIGMVVAACERAPIRRLILNDVGPLISRESLQRIADYAGKLPDFATLDEAIAYIRQIYAPFGQLDDAAWRLLTESSMKQRSDGRWQPGYDPKIAEPFKAALLLPDVDLWPIYERITAETLVLRGESSDVLPRKVWQQMGERGPKAALLEVPGVGHAPSFLDTAQIALVRDFLLRG